jgi:hypothetical protein
MGNSSPFGDADSADGAPLRLLARLIARRIRTEAAKSAGLQLSPGPLIDEVSEGSGGQRASAHQEIPSSDTGS